MSNENDIVRISCQSTNWRIFCLVAKDSTKGIGGNIGEALDRCKGVGCEGLGMKCPTQFKVTRKKAMKLKTEYPDLIIME